MKSETGLNLPALVPKHSRLYGLFMVLVFVGALLLPAWLTGWSIGWSAILGFVLAIIVVTAVGGWFSRYFVALPPELNSFGELVEAAAIRNIGIFNSGGAIISRAECWSGIVEIVSRMADKIPEGGIKPEHKFMVDIFIDG